MPQFDESIVIDRPVDEVAAFATDWFDAPRDGSLLSFRQTICSSIGFSTATAPEPLPSVLPRLGFHQAFEILLGGLRPSNRGGLVRRYLRLL